MQLKIRTTWS